MAYCMAAGCEKFSGQFFHCFYCRSKMEAEREARQRKKKAVIVVDNRNLTR